jgi:hypothetical protein
LKGRSDEQLRKPFELIIVKTESQQTPPEAREFPFITRQETWVAEPETFIGELIERLREFLPQTEGFREFEARRLLKAREYRAAVIAAMTHLEASLRERFDKEPSFETERSRISTFETARSPISMRSLINRAVDQGIINPSDLPNIEKWTRIRNSAVHTARPVSAREAREVVEGVLRILGEART